MPTRPAIHAGKRYRILPGGVRRHGPKRFGRVGDWTHGACSRTPPHQPLGNGQPTLRESQKYFIKLALWPTSARIEMLCGAL